MGAITQAMAKACAAQGVEILTDAPVAQVLVDGGKAAGVELADGAAHRAPRIVASNLNPSLLFQSLVAPADLPAEFRTRIARYRNGSGTFRMNVALSELPDFTCLPGRTVAEHHQSRHHHRAVARLHGRGLSRREGLRLVAASRSSRC